MIEDLNTTLEELRFRSGNDGLLSQHMRNRVSERLCRDKYGDQRHWVLWTSPEHRNDPHSPRKTHAVPPLLWAFPGSGSGWVRLLLEHMTGCPLRMWAFRGSLTGACVSIP